VSFHAPTPNCEASRLIGTALFVLPADPLAPEHHPQAGGQVKRSVALWLPETPERGGSGRRNLVEVEGL